MEFAKDLFHQPFCTKCEYDAMMPFSITNRIAYNSSFLLVRRSKRYTHRYFMPVVLNVWLLATHKTEL